LSSDETELVHLLSPDLETSLEKQQQREETFSSLIYQEPDANSADGAPMVMENLDKLWIFKNGYFQAWKSLGNIMEVCYIRKCVFAEF